MDPEAILAAIEQQRDTDAELHPSRSAFPILVSISARKCTACRWSSFAKSRAWRTSAVCPAHRPASPGWSICVARFCARSTSTRFSGCLPGPRMTAVPRRVSWIRRSDRTHCRLDRGHLLDGPGDIEAPPSTWSAERAACFIGTARVPEGLMGLLDLARVTK